MAVKIREILEDLYEVAYATAEVQEEYISDGEAVSQAQSEIKKLLLTDWEKQQIIATKSYEWTHASNKKIKRQPWEKYVAKALTQAQELKLEEK